MPRRHGVLRLSAAAVMFAALLGATLGSSASATPRNHAPPGRHRRASPAVPTKTTAELPTLSASTEARIVAQLGTAVVGHHLVFLGKLHGVVVPPPPPPPPSPPPVVREVPNATPEPTVSVIPTSAAMAYIFDHESGNDPYAVNPSSGACGLGQADPCSKLTSVCALSDVTCQINFFTQYADARYGSWSAAMVFWEDHHWW